jgi:enediyne polyketide synthase
MANATAASPATSLAVVGLACRFPDSDDPAALLEVVLTGRRCFRRLPPGRVDLADYYQPDMATADATYSTRAAVIEGWRFDHAAFGIEPAAYAAADLAHWLALETTARALAAAGLTAGSGLDRDRTGVIIGNTLAGDTSRANALRVRWPYVRRVLTEALGTDEIPAGQAGEVLRRAESSYLAPFPPMGPDSLAGSLPATIAGAISSYFGFRGGSHIVDSASSSSLQAVASACTALAAGEIDAAITGGVDVGLDPLELIGLARAGLLATTDVRIYDQNPTGYLPGEGCGVVVLMRSADARAAGLPVYAEIMGWGTSAGAAPGEPESNASSQLLAMQRAYDRSGVEPGDIQFIEGNGAGTPADDEAELAALSELRANATRQAALGSVKANIGHANAAAGAAGLIKTVLAVSAGVVPPTSGVLTPHALISSGDARIRLPQAAEEWEGGTRLAAVSTMGIGGSNVHIVLRHEPASRTRAERWLRSMPLLARPADKAESSPAQPMPAGQQALPFLLHAPDPVALAAVLSRLAEIAGWLSDSEMQDLACLLGRDATKQGPARVGLVATRQEQLAVLAREAVAMLPHLNDGLMMARPGIFASNDADGRVTLLLSGAVPSESGQADAASTASEITAAVSQCLDTIRWLESMEVQATGAVGHGLGALAGLAWAGVLGEPEVVDIAELRAQFLRDLGTSQRAASSGAAEAAEQPPVAESAETGDSVARNEINPKDAALGRMDSEALREAIGLRFRFGPPRRRLISTTTGTEISSVAEAIDLICSGFSGEDKVAEAIGVGAVGATLLLETGPGRQLALAGADVSRVPAVSLQSGVSDPMSRARVAAALFAVGALGQPQPLFAGMPARPIDVWRDQVFITNPCQAAPQQPEDLEAEIAPSAAADAEVTGDAAIDSVHAQSPAAAEGEAAVPAAMPAEEPAAIAAEEPDETQEPDEPKDTVPADEPAAVAAEEPHETQEPDEPKDTVPADEPAAIAAEEPDEVQEPDEPKDTVPVNEPAAIAAEDSAAALAAAVVAVAESLQTAEHWPDEPAAPIAADYDFAADAAAVPFSQQAVPVGGIRPWARCFAERLRPAAPSVIPAVARAWRIHAVTRSPMLTDLSALFTADPSANRTLAIIGHPADEQSRLAAVQAARDAIVTGELVVLTTSAGFTGFFASIYAEHPSIGITVLRMPEGARVPAIALQYAHANPAEFRELVIGPAGTVCEPVSAELALSGGGGTPVGADDVVLVSRDSGGGGLVLAQVLALCGAAVAVIGRAGDNDDNELVAGLEKLRSAGARIGYEIIDIGDPVSVTAAVQRIEERLGPVTAIGHGGGMNIHVPFEELTDAQVGRQFAGHAGTLKRLVSSVKPGQLKLIVTFGSVAGRYGMAGASLTALAGSALAERARRLAMATDGCRAMHIDMPAVSMAGMGDRDGLAKELAAADIMLLDLGAGSRLLLKMMTTQGIPASLAMHGRVGGLASWPAQVVTKGQLAAAGLPAGGRFLRETAVHYPGTEFVCTARLSLASDPYLADYRVDGMPVLPPALAVEALAQAASVLAGRPVRLARRVTMESPVVIPSSGDAVIRLCALREGSVITAVLRCADSSYGVDHARAEFTVAANPDSMPAPAISGATPAAHKPAGGPSGLVDDAELYGPICFQSGRFRRIAFLPEVTARSGRALARGNDEQPWFDAGSELAGTSFLLGSPGLNDAVLQVLQACVPHRRVRPIACESVQFSGRDFEGPVEIRAIATGQARPATSPGLAWIMRSVRANVSGQAPAPSAEMPAGTSGGRPAIVTGRVAAAGLAAAVRGADMTAEELADMEIADKRPKSRASRKHRNGQHARSQHGGRGHQRQPAGPAYPMLHSWEAGQAEPARWAAAARTADEADRNGKAGQAGLAGDATRAAARAPGMAEHQQVLVTDVNLDQPQIWDVEAADADGRLLVAWRGVELRDCGPLPRNAAWPPPLLSVFLERSAVELGLAGSLRVTVSCTQLGGESMPLPTALAAIPLQSPPADDGRPGTGQSGTAEPGAANLPTAAPYVASALGAGALAGFGLTVRAAEPVACGWTVVDGGHRQQPAARLATIYAQLRAALTESAPTLAARLDAVGACLEAADPEPGNHVAVRRTTTDGWVLVQLDHALVACAVVEVSGVPAPVAIAILTAGAASFDTDGLFAWSGTSPVSSG